jgi:diguanylate cyclase
LDPPEATVIAVDGRPAPRHRAWTLVHSIGAALLVGEAAFVGSLLMDGLVLPVAWWDRWCHPLLNLGAAGLVLLRAIAGTRRRGPWAVVAAGLLCSAAGDLYYSIALFGRADALFPSAADAFWLLSYPAYYVGLVLLVRASSRQFHQSMWLDGLVAGLGVSAIGVLIFEPIASDARPGTAVLIPLAYPAADVLLVSLVIGVVAARGWRLSGPWMLLAAGSTMNAVADIGFLVLIAGGRYADGSLVNAVWSGAYLVLAAAAWRDRGDDEPVRLAGGRVLVVPVLVTVTSLLVLLGDAAAPVPLAAQLLAAAAISAVLVRTVLTFREVASLAETRRAARTDDLTGLANRRDFYHRVSAATDPGTATTRTVVMLIDLDHFKDVNDSLGHQVGDELLVLVGRRLRERVGASDTVARLGGDEFAILLQDLDLDDAERISATLSDRLREPLVVGPSTLRISGSIGIAAYPDHADDVHGLLRCADFAMYAAKAAGGPRVYDPTSSEHARRSLQTVQELRAVIDAALGRRPAGPAGSLLLHYQPKLDLRSGRVEELEVLVRWSHPRLGMVAPEDFLPLVEGAGLMASLTDVVLHQALAQCGAWRRSGRKLAVAVNVSATSLAGLEFAGRIADALAESRLPPSALVLEITESAIMKDRDRGLDVLHAIHALGVRISVDDYGTGYSSLAYLHELPVDELKLDRSFVARMISDPRAAAIVTSTIGLAHSLGMPIVAEGVETLAALKMLTAAGCDYGQGFLIARPLGPEEVGGWLDRMARPVQPAMFGPA